MQDAVPQAVSESAPATLRELLQAGLIDRIPAAVYAAYGGETGEWLYASPQIEKILGYRAEDFLSDASLWASLIHPDDRARVLAADTAPADAHDAPIEYRMVGKDGQLVWVLDDAVLGPDGEHAMVHHGLLHDITDRKRNEMLLSAHAEAAQASLTGKSLTEIWTRVAQLVELISGAAHCTIEVTPGEDFQVRTAAGATPGTDQFPAVEDCLQQAFRTPNGTHTGRVLLQPRDGWVPQVRDQALVVWAAELAAVVAARAESEARRTESLELLSATLNSTADGILVLDLDDRVVGYNQRLLELWGIAESAVASTAEELLSIMQAQVDTSVASVSAAGLLDGTRHESVTDELTLTSGRVLERYQHVQRGAGLQSVLGRVWSFRDVTAHRLMKQQLLDRALSDPLTGLANRALFVERLSDSLLQLPSHGVTLAVLLLDIDDFKTVNDGLGYGAGDELLVTIADRLRSCLRSRDTAARLAGDEFVILLEDLAEPQEANYAAERILAAVARPITIDGQVLTVRASAGIAVAEGDEAAPDLLRNADLAMNSAKREGGSSCRRFVRSMHSEAVARMELKTDLERAINAEQLSVHYQPVVDLSSGQILGVEALVRWNHPTRGPIPPVDFIPLAEQTGLIERLGRWVLRQACAEAALWRRTIAGQEELSVSVNLSPRQLSNRRFPDEVRRVLWASGLAANGLILEITESTLAEPGVDTVQALNQLKDIGLSLALDDFGTGFSSLAQMVKYPLDVVKVDKSFVDHIDGDPANSALAIAVLNIAKALSLSVTVEGIETVQQRRLLLEMGARRGQGYLMSRPLPADAVVRLLEVGHVGSAELRLQLPGAS